MALADNFIQDSTHPAIDGFQRRAARCKTVMTVYLVEDSPVLRDRIIESLEDTGVSHVVGSADTENDAVTGIQASAPDVVVLDIQLRQGNGLNVLRRLRALEFDVRPLVIMLTNYDIPEFRVRALSAGTDFFFNKATELHRVVELLGGAGGNDSARH